MLQNLFNSFRTSLRQPLNLNLNLQRSNFQQVRFRGQLAPRRTKYRKYHKGRVGVPTGGSTKGTTLTFGEFGLRVKYGVRLTAKTLQSCEESIKRKIKPLKGSQCFMRVFPDLPVCVKGNETRMGKGKGTFEYWAVRCPPNKIIFEVGGGGMRSEVAQEALRLAQAKIGVKTEFVRLDNGPKLGSIYVDHPRSNKGIGGPGLDGSVNPNEIK